LNKKAKLFIGIDTAIMRVSTVKILPYLLFFGPTAVDNWDSWNNDLQYTLYQRSGCVQKNGIHRVYSEAFDCIGCNLHGCNDTYESNCLKKLNMDPIKKNITEMVC